MGSIGRERLPATLVVTLAFSKPPENEGRHHCHGLFLTAVALTVHATPLYACRKVQTILLRRLPWSPRIESRIDATYGFEYNDVR